MNPPYTLDRTVTFFRRLGSIQTMSILTILFEHGSAVLGDLAAATGISNGRMIQLCIELEDLGILRKSHMDKGPGRGLASMSIDPDVSNLMRTYIERISDKPKLRKVSRRYQEMKDAKLLLTDKYQ